MSTVTIVSLVVGGILIVLIAIIAIAHLGRRDSDSGEKRICGGCGRVMMPDWDACLFCGWSPVSRLDFISGPLSGQMMPLSAEVTTLGSVAGNTIVLTDPAVSRKHFGIRRVGGMYELGDLGSTNGVYINGHRMPKKTLVSGDIIRVGNTEMVFRKE